MNTLIKQRPSELAPFEETLFTMNAAKSTPAEMRQWLAARGVAISTMAISKFPAEKAAKPLLSLEYPPLNPAKPSIQKKSGQPILENQTFPENTLPRGT
jgi:hypothetical protein